MASRVCESCGEPVVAGVQFCTSCGYFLGWSESPNEDAAPAPQSAAPVRQPARAADAAEPDAVAPTETMASAGVRAPAETIAPAATDSRPVAAAPSEVGPRRPGRSPTPIGTPCSRCGTPNPPSRRFCAKCGLFIGEPSGTDQFRAFAPPRQRWWQRWLHGRPGSERAARRAYRKSLPWPVRIRRIVIVLGVLLLGFGYLHFVGRDPVRWARHQIEAVRGTLVQVSGVRAHASAAASVVRDFDAANAVDGDSTTAWAIRFTGPTTATGRTCTAGSDTGSLVLQAPSQLTLRAIKVHSGFPGASGTQNWRPRTLELWFPNGSCQRVNLSKSAKPQVVKIHQTKANAVRVIVVAGYEPRGGSQQPLTAITEIALLKRPN